MNRYNFYHVLYVGMINIMLFVPTLLINDRFNGAISSMLLAICYGITQTLITMKCFERFAGLGFPELCDRYLPRWITVMNNFIAGVLLWYPAGVIVIYSYSETIRMFFYPDMNPYINLLLMASAAVWGCSRSTRTVQFSLEIIVILCSPLLIMFLVKAILNDKLRLDSILYVAGYVDRPPSIMAFIAATFLFSGTMNLVVFNRLYTKGFKFRYKWMIPLFGIFFLIVTFFIPIGFHGSVGVQDYVYLWSMTADSMQMEYGFINRVLYVFLLLFSGLSLVFVINAWHTSILFIRQSVNRFNQADEHPSARINILLAVVAAALTFLYMRFVDTERNQLFSEIWLVSRFIAEILIMISMLYFAWRSRKEQPCA
ncbi:hypothetical protein GZH47_09855 [Paenibacillus rhizovicinus]|uniref:GerAB/ArcD/ProY family transporter n=1 Tax=Paenibacillus rhizovicinus TaxID=2704463 RepID=A0A6C0NY52_9BACL|nr:hypothetical protein [Paenibacillus rhizovicinus]QHW31128.1 hypothetical protein GZH47_09855 [Paenibacillus rhizovicinus]